MCPHPPQFPTVGEFGVRGIEAIPFTPFPPLMWSIDPQRSMRWPNQAPQRVRIQDAAQGLSSSERLLIGPHGADLLGVGRPTVRRLIDVELSAEKVGTRHRLLLRDVLEYQQQRRARQCKALAQTAVRIGDEDDPAVVEVSKEVQFCLYRNSGM